MSIRKAIYDIVDGFADGEIYPHATPQETTALYHTYSLRLEPLRHKDGHLTTVYLTLNSFHSDWDTLNAQAETTYTALEALTGTYQSEEIVTCVWLSEDSSYIPDLDKFIITQEYMIQFT